MDLTLITLDYNVDKFLFSMVWNFLTRHMINFSSNIFLCVHMGFVNEKLWCGVGFSIKNLQHVKLILTWVHKAWKISTISHTKFFIIIKIVKLIPFCQLDITCYCLCSYETIVEKHIKVSFFLSSANISWFFTGYFY